MGKENTCAVRLFLLLLCNCDMKTGQEGEMPDSRKPLPRLPPQE